MSNNQAALSRWETFKKYLATKVAFLDDFQAPVVVEVRNLVRAKGKYPYPIEPLLFDQYIIDVVDSLDRCLTYRREARDLEIAGVKAALEYVHFIESRPIEQELERQALGLEVQRIRSDAVAVALKTINPDASNVDHIAYEYLNAEGRTLQSAIQNLQSRSEGVAKKWDLAANLQEEFHSRYIEKGNAHNYPERYRRILNIYADELFEIIAKAHAVSEGIHVLFAVTFDPPDYEGEAIGFLDDMVEWARDAARLLRHHQDSSSIYDVVVPLVQPWRASPDVPFVTADDFSRAIKTQGPRKVLAFEFQDAVFGQAAVRLVGVGLSFGYHVPRWTNTSAPNAWRDYASGYRLRATIHTPSQKRSNGEPYFRPPILLGNVALHAADAPVAWYDGNACHNLNPVGKWRLVVEDRFVWFDNNEHKVSSGFFSLDIPDIKLHLRLKSEVDPLIQSGFSQ